MKNVLILSEFTRASENSTGYIWSKIIARMSKEYSCTVICPIPLDKLGEDAQDGALRRVFASPKFNKNKLASRLFGQLSLTFKFMRELRSCVKKGDVVLTGTNPAFLLLMLPILKRALKFQWVLLVHDVYPENLVPAGVLSKNSLGFCLLKRCFDSVYASADRLIVIGRDMQEVFIQKLGSNERLRFIPNWASLDEIIPISRNESSVIKQQGWSDKIVFQFFGNIGRLQGIPALLEAIGAVTSQKAAFLFIGDGAHRYMIEEFIAKTSAKNVAWVGSLPMEKKNEGLAACDIALVTLQKGMAGLGVPSKAYFSMAADKPLLAVMEPHAEIVRLINEHGIGWHCNPGDAVSLARLIDNICALERDDELVQASPRSVLQAHYSEQIVLNRFVEVVAELQS